MIINRKLDFKAFIDDFKLEYQNLMPDESVSKNLFMVMPIHRETGTIVNILASTEKAETIIGKRNYLSYSQLLPSFKLMKIDDEDIEYINEIIRRIK